MDELLANLNTDAPMFDSQSVLGPAFDMDSGFMPEHADAVSLYAAADMPPSAPATSVAPASVAAPALALAPAEMDYLAVDAVPDADAPVASPTPATTQAAQSVPGKPVQKPARSPVASTAAVAAAAAAAAAAAGAKAAATSEAAIFADLQGLSAPGAPGGVSPQPSRPSSARTSAVPDALLPPPAEDAERRRLRPMAADVVAESWRASRNPAEFVRAIRERLPVRGDQLPPQSIVEESSAPGAPGGGPVRKERPAPDGEVLWQLPDASEGAVLDALFIKLVKGSATSTRLMNYLSYSLVTGIVSQRAIMSTCLKWIAATPGIDERVLQSFAKLMVQIIPHYRFSLVESDLTAEVKEFLAAFTMICNCTAKAPSLAPHLVSVLQDDRVVALVRACARRLPSAWPQINAAITELENPSTTHVNGFADTFAPRSAFAVAPELPQLILRLRKGLAVGITSLESIAASIGNINVPGADATLPIALHTAFAVTLQVFGTEIAKSLRYLWTQREGPGGDFQLLVALEKAAKGSSSSQSQSSAPKYGFRNKVLACEAIVRFLGERSSVPGASEKWKGLWGGKERLKRIIRDAIPQVKSEIRSESGALLVSMAVTCCAAMCLGPAVRMNDANDGVDLVDPAEITLQETQNEEVEESMGELVVFAVGSLEEAATAEEIPSWRSFGLWLLLLMSRSGSILRASGCEHVRAAQVLRTWGGMPTGTPGSHTAHASSHKHSGQSGASHQHAQGSSSSWALTEGVTMFSSPASLAIIDVSDVSGSDDTIRALCNDLVQ